MKLEEFTAQCNSERKSMVNEMWIGIYEELPLGAT
jgi:hypothetical protein